MNTKKLLYAFLREIESAKGKGFELTGEDLGVSEAEFYDIIRLAHREHYVTNVMYADDRPYFYKFIELTIKGIEFLEQNGLWAKAYRSLKEARDWVKL